MTSARSSSAFNNGSFITDQYSLDDVVKDLNEVAPYDWKSFLDQRVYDLHTPVPMNGFSQGGYKLVLHGQAARVVHEGTGSG